MSIYIGMSGWTYPPWRGKFYPKGLVQKKELHYASRQVNSIEINGTFYSLQKPESFERWHEDTPKDFVFSIKAPQYITHIKRFKDVAEPLANFFASGLFCLKEKMGPILWQFHPNLTLKDDRFETFLKLLPQDLKAAQKIAKKHTDKVKGYTTISGNAPIRHAFECRHESFVNKDFFKLLKSYNVAVVMGHSSLKAPYIEELTADFVYLRMHGQEPKYKKGYTPETLNEYGKKIKAWTKTKDAFVYFDTEKKEYSPFDAINLKKKF